MPLPQCEARAVAATGCKAGGAAAISTVVIGRDCVAGIAAPSRVAIYNGDPTRSLKIAYFKWSGIGEDAEDRRLIRSYVLGRDFDNHVRKRRGQSGDLLGGSMKLLKMCN